MAGVASIIVLPVSFVPAWQADLMKLRADAVRDLEWSINSPSLIERVPPTCDDQSPSVVPRVDIASGEWPFDQWGRQCGHKRTPVTPAIGADLGDRLSLDSMKLNDSTELNAFLANVRTDRVGIYFEQLIRFWLIHVLRLPSVQHSIQVQRGNRTVGELDFLFRDHFGRLTHMETAVKFYLHYQGKLIGPNANDEFQLKMRRMFDHQFQLGRDKVTALDRQLALVRGRIFYHPTDIAAGSHSATTTPIACPSVRLSPAHLRGIWIRDHELDQLDHLGPAVRYQVIEKTQWLAPLSLPIGDQPAGDELSSGSERLWKLAELKQLLGQRFSAQPRSLLIATFALKGGSAVETGRIFVVPRTWPDGR